MSSINIDPSKLSDEDLFGLLDAYIKEFDALKLEEARINKIKAELRDKYLEAFAEQSKRKLLKQ